MMEYNNHHLNKVAEMRQEGWKAKAWTPRKSITIMENNEHKTITIVGTDIVDHRMLFNFK